MNKLVVVVGWMSGCIMAGQIELEKVYLHGAHEHTNEKGPRVEEARLVFYFNRTPKKQIAHKKAARKEWESLVIALPNVARPTGELKTALDAIQKRKNDLYQITINQQKNGDMEIVVTYNARMIAVSVDEFSSIGNKPGLSLTLYHQPTLQHLKKAQQSILQVAQHAPTLVIDAGHGGKDTGAVGAKGAVEKDIALRVGNKLADAARHKGYRVTMVRSDDVFVELDQRTAYAHRDASCLFISIHANHAQDTKAQGIETFYFDGALMTHLYPIDKNSHGQLMSDNSSALSKELAQKIHAHILIGAHSLYPQAVDRTVKKACSQVLMGAFVPAALVELGFLSNMVEESYLMNDTYLDRLVDGIMAGVDSFVGSHYRSQAAA